MDSYTVTIPLGTLFEVIVTRTAGGQFHVWLDGVHQLEAESTHLDTSTYFIVRICESGYIDDITVYDEILTQPPNGDNGEPPPPPIPGFPTVAIALGFIAALTLGLIVKRKKPS
jgi:hypothetical protein